MLNYLVKNKASDKINQTRNQTRENQIRETKPTPSQNQNKPANLKIKVESKAVPDFKSFLKNKKLDRAVAVNFLVEYQMPYAIKTRKWGQQLPAIKWEYQTLPRG